MQIMAIVMQIHVDNVINIDLKKIMKFLNGAGEMYVILRIYLLLELQSCLGDW